MTSEVDITVKIMNGLRQATSGLQEAIEDNLGNANEKNQQMEVAEQNLSALSELISYTREHHLLGRIEIDTLHDNYLNLKEKYFRKRTK